MKRKFAFLLALVMTLCLFVTACGDDTKNKKEELKDLQEEIEDLEEELDELKTQESTLKSEINEVTVPRFIGKMYHEVENNIAYAQKFDLKFKWEDARDPDVKEGEIFRQNPAADKKVEKGATITLYVNNATPKDIQLDVRVTAEGMHKNDMRKLLVDAGFEVVEVLSSSEVIPEGCVISIDIRKGETYVYGHKVTVLVSTGPLKLALIPFPQDIIGESKTAVEDILKSYGFVGTIAYIEQNYTNNLFADKGTLMGVMVDGVLLETLPTEIHPDADLTLIVSTGISAEDAA